MAAATAGAAAKRLVAALASDKKGRKFLGYVIGMKDHFHSPQHAVDIIKNKCFFNKACSSAREMPAVGMDSDARNVLLKHFPSRFLLKARPFCPPF